MVCVRSISVSIDRLTLGQEREHESGAQLLECSSYLHLKKSIIVIINKGVAGVAHLTLGPFGYIVLLVPIVLVYNQP